MNPEQLGVVADLRAVAGLDLAAYRQLVWSLGLLAAAGLLRWIAPILLRRDGGLLSDRQRWWINFLKNLATVALLGGLIAIWAQELENAALSLAAFAVALVVATKELILCLTGAAWRGFASPFGVGDWVEIGGFSGEVIEEDLLATQLQEIDWQDYRPTGRVISVPNSALFTQPIVNHSFRKRFIHLVFELHAEEHEGALERRARIEAAVAERSAGFADLAQRYAARIERSTGARFRDPAPRVTIHTTDMGRIVYRISVFCPRDRAAELREVAAVAFLGGKAPASAAEQEAWDWTA